MPKETYMSSIDYQLFMHNKHRKKKTRFTYVSLFSGAGIGEYGLKLAGGECLGACEIDEHRRNVHAKNIGSAGLFSNIVSDKKKLVERVLSTKLNVDLLIASPPCQGFSTANAKRGKREDPEHASRDSRNTLFFEALDIAVVLNPKFIVFENVPNFPNRMVHNRTNTKTDTILNFMKAILCNYRGHSLDLCVSDYGIPQRRKRSIILFVRQDIDRDSKLFELIQNKFNFKIYNNPTNLREVFEGLDSLDAKSLITSYSKSDELHQVPVATEARYSWISDIPKDSGKSAWENACTRCYDQSTPIFEVICRTCGTNMYNRPHVQEKDYIRAIKGFKTSYKRMLSNEISPTITTNSNSFSSDMKIHPYENRVLSVREVALIQTIPYSFYWPPEQFFKSKHLIREMIGEAIPPLFTYQLGLTVRTLLTS